ncbi:MAG: type IV pilus twitching motility protein PilT [bacterium]|nr:type IV pilus twitching motility protein PilT [bacterium]
MITMEELLLLAKEKKASDVHITVGIPAKCRVNGDLVDMGLPTLMPENTESLVKSILNQSQLEKLEENGEVDFSYAIKQVGRYRVNAFKQRGTYAAAIRLVGTDIPTPERLGLPKSIVDLTNKKRGLVLVTGPTGSGKSTSLASLINIINQQENDHIITLEDPIEYLHKHSKAIVNQREIGLDSRSFSDALRAALRQDPDVILVGEMRDLDTISIAVTAAETGHLVFSTLHTIGAASTIDRIVDAFPPHQQQQIKVQLASVLECIISQQLIPTMDGLGRVAAFEIMHVNSAIRNLIREGKTHQIQSIIQTNRKLGMQTMDDSIFELYARGMINSEEAINCAVDSAVMSRKVF